LRSGDGRSEAGEQDACHTGADASGSVGHRGPSFGRGRYAEGAGNDYPDEPSLLKVSRRFHLATRAEKGEFFKSLRSASCRVPHSDAKFSRRYESTSPRERELSRAPLVRPHVADHLKVAAWIVDLVADTGDMDGSNALYPEKF
jgi:hypothetical protein